jgi:NAD(P)-dependent dehydrogenase (short-subunit alcohol dehydrogenase family)
VTSRDARPLSGRVVIVGVNQADVARTMVDAGATVICVGADANAVGALERELEARGRVAAFVGDLADEPSRVALVELVRELFPDRS